MQFKRQHDIRRNANGNITLFDNGDGPVSNPFHYSSAKEYLLDETLLNAELVWSFVDNFNALSTAMGNFDHRPQGNSLINYGAYDLQSKVFNVVNNSGQIVFEIAFDDTLRSYRSFNYPQMPWSFNRPVISCYENSGQLYIDAGSGHASYYWSNGATTQVIPVTDTGTFYVFVPNGNDGFISSEWAIIDDLSNPCSFTGLPSMNEEIQFISLSNPVSDELVIFYSGAPVHNELLTILDLSGKVIHSEMFYGDPVTKLPVADLADGIYLIKVMGLIRKFVKQ
jgi:hypothetical protein